MTADATSTPSRETRWGWVADPDPQWDDDRARVLGADRDTVFPQLRRVAGERLPGDWWAVTDGGRVVGVVALQHHQRLDRHVEPLAPAGRRAHERGRLLEGVGRRQDHDAIGAGCGDEAPVEVVVGGEGSASHEGDRAWHGGRS